MASNNDTGKSRMRLPHKLFHSTISEPESYQSTVEDDDFESDSSSFKSDFENNFSLFKSDCFSLPEDSEHDPQELDSPLINCSSLSLDDSPTHQQVSDLDDEDNSMPPLSPPRSASYFDCNMCLKMARGPVVTSCGHLYCWPCLYSWLNFYSAQRVCLVCKSKVRDSLITPIHNNRAAKSAGFNVPPRPTGLRLS